MDGVNISGKILFHKNPFPLILFLRFLSGKGLIKSLHFVNTNLGYPQIINKLFKRIF